MTEKQIEKAKPSFSKPEPVNEDVQRGVWVDGIGLGLSSDYIIIEGIVAQPRTDKPYIAVRLMFPPRLLEHLAKNLTDAVRKQKELTAPQVTYAEQKK